MPISYHLPHATFLLSKQIWFQVFPPLKNHMVNHRKYPAASPVSVWHGLYKGPQSQGFFEPPYKKKNINQPSMVPMEFIRFLLKKKSYLDVWIPQ